MFLLSPFSKTTKIKYQFILVMLLACISLSTLSCDDSNNNDSEQSDDQCTATAPECTADNKGYRVCVSGTWSDVIPCTGDTSCQKGQCLQNSNTCTATAPECTEDNKGYRVCVSGTWSDVIDCPNNTTCQNGQCSEEYVTSKLPCSSIGKTECVSFTRVKVCGKDEYWSFMDCPSDIPLCDMNEYSDSYNKCVPAQCHNGTSRCSNQSTLETCTNYHWVYPKCPTNKPVCQGGECREKPCTPKDKKCISDTQAAVCSSDGTWVTVDCTGGAQCKTDECVAPECNPDQAICSDDYHSIYTCVNGNWKKTSCSSATPYCPAGQAQCTNINRLDSCSGSFSLCKGNVLYSCSDGIITQANCDACLYAQDGIGAACSLNGFSDSCLVGETITQDDGVCLMCKLMPNNTKRFIAVDDSYCD